MSNPEAAPVPPHTHSPLAEGVGDSAAPSTDLTRLPADSRALDRVARRAWVAADEPWLHGEVAVRMAQRLPLFKVRPRAIVQWGAPRGGCALLRDAYPQADVWIAAPAWVATEAAPAPVRRAWLSKLLPVTRAPSALAAVVVADDAVPAAKSDLLWANMVLHAAADLPLLLDRWHAAMAVESTLMFSTFGPDTLRELRALYRANGWGPHTAEPVDMHDIGDALVHAGFADPVMDQERLTLHWASPQALLAELRGLGANASPDRHEGLRTPRWRERLHAGLHDMALNGRISLTMEIVYGHAFKVGARGRGASAGIAVADVAASLPSRRRRAG